MSVSALVTYTECPLRYFWSVVDRLPRRPSAAARRGVDVHRRIELHNRGAVPLEDPGIDNYDITPADLEEGDRITNPYESFRSSRFATDRPLLVEAPFDLRLDDGTIVRGRIDAVYGDDSAWEVVDFKSGRPRDDPARRVQLQAYAVAVRDGAVALDPPGKLAVTFAYLGDGLTEVTEQADDEWVAEARQRIDLITKGISEEVFDPIPSEACAHCDFLTFCASGKAFLAETG
jgi:DNA helicase-2/ATP-dependent DNA helicase PcrA